MRRLARHTTGSAIMEFTLVGIPIIFLLISLFEVGRGMWTYHMVAASVKAGTRYASVHGLDCTIPPNSCLVTIGQIAGRIQQSGRGLLWDQLNLTFTPANGTAVTCTLDNCLSNTSTFPPLASNSPGIPIAISGTYPFRSIISMFWPGAGHPAGMFAATNFGTVSKEVIQF